MSNKNIILNLTARKDKNGQTFYVHKMEAPVLIDCSKGIVFLVYTSEKGAEELQIAPMEKNDQPF